MSTTPSPPDPVPEPTPDPAPAVPTTAEPTGSARAGVPRWLLITIIAVVVVAIAVVGFLTLTGNEKAEPQAETPHADVTTISGGPITFLAQVQWNLDNNGYIYRGSRCTFTDPSARFESETETWIACLLIFVPDTVVLDGRDIVVTQDELTIADGAEVLEAPGCPATSSTVALPPPGTSPGPPIACVVTDLGDEFAIFLTAMSDAGPTLAVARLS